MLCAGIKVLNCSVLSTQDYKVVYKNLLEWYFYL